MPSPQDRAEDPIVIYGLDLDMPATRAARYGKHPMGKRRQPLDSFSVTTVVLRLLIARPVQVELQRGRLR